MEGRRWSPCRNAEGVPSENTSKEGLPDGPRNAAGIKIEGKKRARHQFDGCGSAEIVGLDALESEQIAPGPGQPQPGGTGTVIVLPHDLPAAAVMAAIRVSKAGGPSAQHLFYDLF